MPLIICAGTQVPDPRAVNYQRWLLAGTFMCCKIQAQASRWHVSVLYVAGAGTAQASNVLAFTNAGTFTPVQFTGARIALARDCAVICMRRHRAGIAQASQHAEICMRRHFSGMA